MPAMYRTAVAALALLAACTHDPARIADGAPPHTIASGAGPKQLANCTARNARSFSDQYTSSVSELVRPDNYRVVVTGTQRNYAPIIVAYATPVPEGSHIAIYLAADLGSAERADWIERMRRGCEVEVVRVVPLPRRETLPPTNPAPATPVPPPPQGGRPTRG
jgi:hypothetical protein